ncbi:hypothetical protein RBG61_05660 [Paludicola sp. MB14-C6]|uniref:hypothetical protein n=1 Tax=Paludihabitans sp. MB14-C6 TaxID=3070656 RepID=UPI0027DB48E4|nr:hypothetical protein [Paludicola sp. MB14-C6]WMJ24151.1 hypothetical protein RBG61_05660 [Paludicola sp. MB14-C6]
MKKAALLSLPIGAILFVGTRIYANYLTISDFTLGFFEGLSFSFMAIGFVMAVWCLAKKENPFRK